MKTYAYEAASLRAGTPVRVADCQWFLNCKNKATGYTPHPTLGDVPTCDRCHKFATGKSRKPSKTKGTV